MHVLTHRPHAQSGILVARKSHYQESRLSWGDGFKVQLLWMFRCPEQIYEAFSGYSDALKTPTPPAAKTICTIQGASSQASRRLVGRLGVIQPEWNVRTLKA